MDTLIHGGRIHLVDSSFQTADAVWISGDRVAAVGNESEVRAAAPAGVDCVDVRGATVVPGLTDSHMHLCKEIRAWGRVDLRGSASVGEVLDRVRAYARNARPGSWVIASPYWHETETRENRLPTRQELDSAVPGHPVMIPRGMYRCAVNTKALELAGIDRDTPDPPDGRIARDGDGEPTGMLWRGALGLVQRIIPPPTFEESITAMKGAMKYYNSLGLTSVRDPGVPAEDARVYQAIWERGEMTVRVNMLPRSDQAMSGEPLGSSDVTVGRLNDSPVRTGFGDSWLRVGALKMLIDGGIEDAYMAEPYATDPSYRGFVRMSTDVLDDIMAACAANRWAFAMHVSGDAAMTEYLAAIERISRRFDIGPLGWAIEHAFFTTPAQCEFIHRHGISVTVQPALIYDFGDAFAHGWGANRARKMIATKTMLATGLRPGGGSDGPYVNPSPLMGMQVLMTRETARAGVFGPDQAVDSKTALAMYTRDNARITGEQQDRGTLEPGRLADLTVLGDDPLTCDPGKVGSIEVLMTMVGGRIVHRSGI